MFRRPVRAHRRHSKKDGEVQFSPLERKRDKSVSAACLFFAYRNLFDIGSSTGIEFAPMRIGKADDPLHDRRRTRGRVSGALISLIGRFWNCEDRRRPCLRSSRICSITGDGNVERTDGDLGTFFETKSKSFHATHSLRRLLPMINVPATTAGMQPGRLFSSRVIGKREDKVFSSE